MSKRWEAAKAKRKRRQLRNLLTQAPRDSTKVGRLSCPYCTQLLAIHDDTLCRKVRQGRDTREVAEELIRKHRPALDWLAKR